MSPSLIHGTARPKPARAHCHLCPWTCSALSLDAAEAAFYGHYADEHAQEVT